ncbi:hypothetical protein GCM10027084_04470 [Pseudoxanthomonas sangjuensis]|uniref:PilX N-terminal domain-containing pilus assembly protein n=1 Tax=Pseudoxanthomonas sangjuensis TaxID=1503750 RepID=UPI00139100BB|nr:PilX N-terminal domain-containing pilus assembly protein [Pseudoxanthomonas sangjuensis]KAF1706534.1 hypothetical protein CSC71_14130 [Pseudoxanthomonas sangjuensis]
MNTNLRNHPPRRQQGVSTLLIAMLLLAILTIITLFAARYGVNEQRTSGNEYRYKMAFHAAETGLHQSLEYVKLNTMTMLSTATGGWLDPVAMQWQPCSTATTMDPDPCLAGPSNQRAGMYRYVGGTNGVLPVSDAIPADALDMIGEFDAGYASYATLCRLDMTIPESPQCALTPTTDSGEFYITVVSRGTIENENAVATVKQSFGTFHLLGRSPDAPLIAAGTSIGLGNAEIVPNPDAGGPGIPISIWSAGDAQISAMGSFETCHLGEWLNNYGNPAPSSQDVLNGICASCSCSGVSLDYGMLSGHKGGDKYEGEDIIDIDSNSSDATPKVMDAQNFPSDLFAYTFGVSRDNAVEYLTQYATQINSCAALDGTSSGLYWVTGADASCSLPDIVGSLTGPVVLVSDVPVSGSGNKKQFFGVIFVRETAGTDAFTLNGGQIYGSVVLEGGGQLHGSPSIVYNKAVLANIRNSPGFVRYGPIPGSWSDSLQ